MYIYITRGGALHNGLHTCRSVVRASRLFDSVGITLNIALYYKQIMMYVAYLIPKLAEPI